MAGIHKKIDAFNWAILVRFLWHMLEGFFQLSLESTCKLSESIFIQSQCTKVYFNEMQALAVTLQVGFAISENRIYRVNLASTIASQIA